MGRRRGRKTIATGRSDSEQFAPLPYAMLRSPAWRSLSGPAVKVWLELRALSDGANNGRLSLSLEEGNELLGLGKATVGGALVELQEKGFLDLARRGNWYHRQASLWGVADKGGDGVPPTNSWRKWQNTAPSTAVRY